MLAPIQVMFLDQRSQLTLTGHRKHAAMAADSPLRVFARSNNAMGCVGSLRPFDSGSSIVVSRSEGFRTSQFPTQTSPL